MKRCHKCYCSEIKSTSVTIASNIMQVTVIPLQAYADYDFYIWDLGAALPAHTGIEPVSISDGVNSYPVIDTNGQPVVSGKLRGHKKYRVRFGAGGALSSGTIPAHFTVYEGLCPMEYSSNPALQAPEI